MKNILKFSIFIFLILSVIGCSDNTTTPTNNSLSISEDQSIINSETILNSYYSSKNSAAYELIQSGMISRIIEDWATENLNDIESPKWNYDSFTQYQSLDNNLNSITEDQFYYCTFLANENKYGYVVLKYHESSDGRSFELVTMAETTPYQYDLQENIEEITEKLKETDIDLSSVVVSRVQLIGDNDPEEAILFTDDSGSNYLFFFDTFEIEIH